MLQLSASAAHHHSTSAMVQETAPDLLDKYNTTYGNSTGRQSPLSPSSFQEPSSRMPPPLRRPPSSPSTSTAAATEYHLLGFAKPPHSFPTTTPPALRRTVSEPIYSSDTINSATPRPPFSEFPTSPGPVWIPPPQEISNGNTVQESSPFPNPAPVIHRTASDPNPVANRQVAAVDGTPPRPPTVRNISSYQSCEECRSTKRLKRMKERMREMSQWWNQVLHEGDEEDRESEKYSTDNIPKEEFDNDMEKPSQEAVWVDKNGECLVLHFKCPCGNGYQILLFGNNCYYKLTNF